MQVTERLERWLNDTPKLATWPDQALLADCKPLPALAADLHEDLRRRMLQCMTDWRGAGLSAPQVGLPYRMFVMRLGGVGFLLTNPTFVIPRAAQTLVSKEGCLSLPGVVTECRRKSAINLSSDKQVFHLAGMEALIAQHELDHLAGTLIVHRARCQVCEKPVAKVDSDLVCTTTCQLGHTWHYCRVHGSVLQGLDKHPGQPPTVCRCLK